MRSSVLSLPLVTPCVAVRVITGCTSHVVTAGTYALIHTMSATSTSIALRDTVDSSTTEAIENMLLQSTDNGWHPTSGEKGFATIVITFFCLFILALACCGSAHRKRPADTKDDVQLEQQTTGIASEGPCSKCAASIPDDHSLRHINDAHVRGS